MRRTPPSPPDLAEQGSSRDDTSLLMGSVAAAALAYGAWRNDGFFSRTALAAVTFAGVVAAVAGWSRRPWRWVPAAAPRWIVSGFLVWAASASALSPYGAVVRTPSFSLVGLLQSVVALLLLGAIWWDRARSRLLAVTVILFSVGAVTTLETHRRPNIDVWHLHQLAGREILAGLNPYAATYLVRGSPECRSLPDHVTAPAGKPFPYPPLSLVAAALGSLVGDVRWLHLAALLLFVVVLARQRRRGHWTDVASALMLAHPRTLFVLHESWTDPILLLALAVALTHRRGCVGLAALPLAKQYGVFFAPAVLPTVRRWSHLGWATLGAAAVLAPFAIWDAPALYAALISHHAELPARGDALTFVAASLRGGGPTIPRLSGFVVALILLAPLLSRAPRSPSRRLLTAAAAYVGFCLFSSQAFLNSYWTAFGVTVAALGVEGAVATEPVNTDSP